MKNHLNCETFEKVTYLFFDSNSKEKINKTPNTVLISIMALHKQIFLFKILMLLEQEKFGNSSMPHKNIQWWAFTILYNMYSKNKITQKTIYTQLSYK